MRYGVCGHVGNRGSESSWAAPVDQNTGVSVTVFAGATHVIQCHPTPPHRIPVGSRWVVISPVSEFAGFGGLIYEGNVTEKVFLSFHILDKLGEVAGNGGKWGEMGESGVGMRRNGGKMGKYGGKMETMGTEMCELRTGVLKCGRIRHMTAKSFHASIPLIQPF